MHAKVLTCAVVGLEGVLVEVEVDIPPQGLANFLVVGLPDTAVQEARERVRAAVKNSGLVFPMRRITVSLAPAELRKSGPSYDLPIAVALLLASGQVEATSSACCSWASWRWTVRCATPRESCRWSLWLARRGWSGSTCR